MSGASKTSPAIDVELRQHQLEVYDSLRRFNVLLAHRRFGKTVLATWMLLMAAAACKHKRPQVHYYCPSYSQAKRVAWSYVKEFTGKVKGVKFNEQELKATLPGGAIIQLGSAENPDSSRGIYSDFCVLDEPAQMPPRMWSEVLRPALSDRQGGALFIGTPQGRHGLFYDAWCDAETNPEWWRGVYRASQTSIVQEAELRSAQKAMSTAEYDQEYECSWDAAVKGAYWAEAMQKADTDNRIRNVIHTYGHSTHIAMDLGMNDATACWFFQIDGDLVRMIDYAEYTNMGLPDIVADWKVRGYHYGKVICPHDIQVRSLSTGMTRLQTLYNLGVDAIVAPNTTIIDGIDQVRGFLNRCVFDREKCKDGIEALRQYRSDWEDKRGVLRLRPLHDWCSHAADSMRYLAVTGTDALSDMWGKIDYSRMDRGMVA